MRQRVQQLKRTQAKTANRKPSQPAHVRPTVVHKSNHLQAANDKWERQADEAAVRVHRGEQNVANRLTPINAASFRLPGSAGQPLPEAPRALLEEGFGADLSAVRIHNNAQADSVARQQGAKAFTSGTHIYFQEGFYRPHSQGNMALLTHEVSHVLQQTGRPAWGGGVKATDIHGVGDIQREWRFNVFLSPYREHAELPTEADTPHSPDEVAAQESFRRIELAIRNVIGLDLTLTEGQGESEAAVQLEARIVGGGFENETTEAKTLLFDVLKIWGRFNGAAHLLINDPDIQTRYYPNNLFYDFLVASDEYGTPAVGRLLESEHADFHNIWPYNLTTALWQYLTQPERDIRITTPGYPSDYNNVWAEFDAREEIFIPNELYLIARNEMLLADTLLHNSVLAAIEQFGQSEGSFWFKKFVANQLVQSLASGESGESRFVRQARRGLRSIAVAANEYWSQVLIFRTEIATDMAPRMAALLRGRGNLDRYPRPEYEFPEEPILWELVGAVEEHTENLFYSPNDLTEPAVVTQSQYAEDVSHLQPVLASFAERLSAHMGNIFVYGRRNDAQLAARARWLGWAQVWVALAKAWLHSYHVAADEASPSNDKQLRHRLHLAGMLYQLGLASGNEYIIDTAEAVFAGSDMGQSYILLSNNWRNTHHDLNKLTEDYSAGYVIQGWGVTVHQLVLFYHILYQQDTAAQLMAGYQVAPGTSTDTPDHRAFVHRQIEQYNTVMSNERVQRLFPKRYENSDAIINYLATDTSTLSDVLRRPGSNGTGYRSTEYTQFLSRYAPNSGQQVLLPLGRPSQLCIWVLPPFQALYEVLKDVDLLNALVPAGTTDASDWMFALGSAIANMSDDRQGAFNTQLRAVYDQASSRAYSWRRRRHTEEVRSKLIVAANNRHDIGHYGDMGDAMMVMRQFSFSIRPREAIPPQMSAMMLDLADELRNALLDRPSDLEDFLGIDTRVDTRYDIITSYYGMINQALTFLGGVRARQQIAKVVVVNDQAQEGETPEAHRTRIQQEKQAKVSALMGKQSVLTDINTQLSSAILRIQEEGIGFEGRRNGVKSFNYASTLPLQQEMRSEGKVYLIDAVFADFNYFPPYGTDAEHPSLLRLVSGSDSEPANRERRTRLLRYTEDGREFVVTTHQSDDHHLTKLARVIEDTAFVQSMENLADVIEGAAELTLDLIELVPGFGQGVMVARMGVEVTRFVAEDLPNIIDSLNNPQELFNQLEAWFDQQGWVENILEYLLFRADTFAFPAALSTQSEDPNQSRRRRHRGLDRVIHAVRTLGEKIFYAFQLLQRVMRGGFARAQLSLVEYRTLMRILEILPGLALTAVDMAAMTRAWAQRMEDQFEGTPLSPSALIAELISSESSTGGGGNIQSQMQTTFGQIVEGLHSVELPENVIPMDSLVDVLIGYVLDRFGRKGRLLNTFLETVGARDAIAKEIEKGLIQGTNIDVNVHWRRSFREPLQAKLVELQNFVINDGMNPLIRQTMGAQYMVNTSQIGQPQIEASPSQEPETQPHSRGGSTSDDAPVLWPGMSAGSPLSYQQRLSLESEFGHNLSHVRLHTDDSARRFTDSADAHALTSGSHIYLSSDTNIDHQDGRHILRHELAHVLQQTGERPLGEEHSSQPTLGRPGIGVRYDRHKEAAADRMAALAGRIDGMVPVEEEGGAGYYPTSRRFVLKMLNHLSDSQVAEQVAEDMEDSIPRMSTEELQSFNTAKSEAKGLWRAVNREISGGQQRDFDAPYHSGKNLISAALGTLYNDSIDALTYRSVRQRSNGRYQLRTEKFLSQLRTYIYGRTGIVLSITSSGERVTRVRVTYIHLGNAPTNLSIWTHRNGVKRNTEGAATTEQRDVLHRNWARIRDHIRSLNYTTRNVWHSSEFRLSDAFIRELAEHFRNVADDEVAVGNWEQYTTPTLSSSERQVGLRVATHGQLTATRTRSTPLPPAPAGVANPRGDDIHQAAKAGRESHHIPQYLLVEYFRNQASTKMFPAGESLMPGFEGSRNALDSFSGGTGQQIDLSTLDPGGRSNRGLNLPAVSIAAVTHQRGQLHVNQATQWSQAMELTNGNTGTLTQSLWLDFYFYQQVERHSRRHVSGAQRITDKSAIISRVRSLTPPQAKTVVYTAMKDSYQTMYSNMMDMIDPALNRHEIPYYRDIVRANVRGAATGPLPGGYEPNGTRFGTVKTALETLNDRIMHEWK
jgi:hypothetical protein